MRHLQYILVALGVALASAAVGTGCAQGVSNGNGVPDARPLVQPDGGAFPDAGNPFPDARAGFPDANTSFPDANVSFPDAATGGSCQDTAFCQAQNPLTCCYQNQCVVGVDFGAPIGCVPLN